MRARTPAITVTVILSACNTALIHPKSKHTPAHTRVYTRLYLLLQGVLQRAPQRLPPLNPTPGAGPSDTASDLHPPWTSRHSPSEVAEGLARGSCSLQDTSRGPRTPPPGAWTSPTPWPKPKPGRSLVPSNSMESRHHVRTAPRPRPVTDRWAGKPGRCFQIFPFMTIRISTGLSRTPQGRVPSCPPGATALRTEADPPTWGLRWSLHTCSFYIFMEEEATPTEETKRAWVPQPSTKSPSKK